MFGTVSLPDSRSTLTPPLDLLIEPRSGIRTPQCSTSADSRPRHKLEGAVEGHGIRRHRQRETQMAPSVFAPHRCDRDQHSTSLDRSRVAKTGQGDRGEKAAKITPSDCPKYDPCNAPICPLDSQMLERVHLWGEPTCFYLRLFAKQGLQGLFSTSVPRQVAKRVAKAYPIVIDRYEPIKKQLARAAKCPARGFSKSPTEEINLITRPHE